MRFVLGRLALAGALFLAALPLYAKRDPFSQEPQTFDFDETLVEEWKESEVAFPPYPNDRDLLPVVLPAPDTLKVHIDQKSISRAPDRVARFTLVVESSSGTRNVFYDGMRCEVRQYKTYAVGTPERTLAPVKNAQWRDIPRPAVNAFRDHLYRHYVCDQNSTARTPQELVRAIKYQP